MTVAELIEILKQFPPEMEVETWEESGSEEPAPEMWRGKVML